MTSIKILQLRDLLKSFGLGIDTAIADEINRRIFNGQSSFCLDTDTLLGESVHLKIRLMFAKSPENEEYFLHAYRVTHHLPDDPTNDRTQSFDMTIGMPINLKEAFNLLQGRAVFKEIAPPKDEKYFAWVQLNFQEKEPNGNYKVAKFRSYRGFDLGPILSRYPILELKDEGRKKEIILGLKSGDRKKVTFEKPTGKPQEKFIEFNPMHKSINIYAAPKALQKVK
jgi:hypothetical protein